MLLNVTPFTFLFSALYVLVLSLLPSVSNFILYWLIIEVIMLLFMGVAYSSVTSSISPVMVFFLAQAVSSFIILFSFILNIEFLVTLGLLLNIGIFPLFSWFVYSVSLFPSFLLFISCTLNKLPVLILITSFDFYFSFSSIWVLLSLNVLVSGAFMFLCTNLRSLLVISSVANNSWFVAGQMAGPSALFLFFLIYSLALLIALSVSTLTTPSFSEKVLVILLISITVISGLPPSPLFAAKVLLLTSLAPSSYILLFLVCNSVLVCSYVVFSIKYITWSYSSSL